MQIQYNKDIGIKNMKLYSYDIYSSLSSTMLNPDHYCWSYKFWKNSHHFGDNFSYYILPFPKKMGKEVIKFTTAKLFACKCWKGISTNIIYIIDRILKAYFQNTDLMKRVKFSFFKYFLYETKSFSDFDGWKWLILEVQKTW